MRQGLLLFLRYRGRLHDTEKLSNTPKVTLLIRLWMGKWSWRAVKFKSLYFENRKKNCFSFAQKQKQKNTYRNRKNNFFLLSSLVPGLGIGLIFSCWDDNIPNNWTRWQRHKCGVWSWVWLKAGCWHVPSCSVSYLGKVQHESLSQDDSDSTYTLGNAQKGFVVSALVQC